MRAEGKKTSQGMPSAVCYPQALYMEPVKVLKINSFSSRHQRPGEKCGLARARPAQCVTARRANRTNKLLKINRLSL